LKKAKFSCFENIVNPASYPFKQIPSVFVPSRFKVMCGELGGVLEMEVSVALLSSPLHCACAQGHVEVVSVLLSAGAALEARDEVSRRR
jgi:hypothetical protein